MSVQNIEKHVYTEKESEEILKKAKKLIENADKIVQESAIVRDKFDKTFNNYLKMLGYNINKLNE